MIIQSLWLGPISKLEINCIVSFLKKGYDYQLYTYEKIPNLPSEVTICDGNEILPRSDIFSYGASAGKGQGSVSAFSNFFRYKLLFEKGGIWADTDIMLLSNIDDSPYIFATQRQPDGSKKTASCFIKCPHKSEIMNYCYDVCLSKNKNDLKWGEIGPNLLHEAISRYNLENYKVDPEVFCPIDWWLLDKFLLVKPYCPPNNARCIHFWNEMWRRNNFDKNYFEIGMIFSTKKNIKMA